MLYACSNRKHSAIGVFGDYYDLRDLYNFVSTIASGKELPSQMQEFLWSFAYDLRKAYEGKRETKELGFDGLDKAKYRGVYIYWPYFIVYLKLLRQALARRPITRLEQSTIWLLEGLCETTLSKYSPETAKHVLHWQDYLSSFPDTYVHEWLSVCCRKYLEEKRGKRRLASLVTFVERISPISKDYQDYHKFMESEANRLQCSIFQLTDPTPWPKGEEI